MEEENYPFEYWEIIRHKTQNIKDWIDENQIDGKLNAEDIKQLVNQTFELENW